MVLLGIGGSALGPLCVHQSVCGNSPRFHVVDNIDPLWIQEIDDSLDYKETLFLVITKSGSTPETLAQYFYFSEKTKQKGLKLEDHFVFITDPHQGLLRKIANEHPGLITFEIPPKVGGRFSVLSAVGLVPAILMGVDIEALWKGARQMREAFLSPSFDTNLPFQLASIQYLLAQKGKTSHVLMPYAQRLVRFADWTRQLLAESIGKAKNDRGETVHVGLTPIPALGATDQHSQSQLYHEGPNDKLIIFMEVEDFGVELLIPTPYPEESSVDFLNGVSFNRLLNTEKEGTVRSLTHCQRPNITLHIDRVNEHSLGELFMLFEGATAFLGEFYGINAFDQPGVELSKQITKQLLKGLPVEL
ncbi:MAG: Glucose-6-phosphate isomerase [Candidatus Peregrinibacteria bacterium GW2011_GWA2_44_7]|nr:MAG: Glucose-6-phosphate isomerase [Candidatus Peregrinibacteria bacterium GW2011_GWA2_44_7]